MTAASRADLAPGGPLVPRNAALGNAFTYTKWGRGAGAVERRRRRLAAGTPPEYPVSRARTRPTG
jgi:hypothetical protein